jgi:hypothetical protein
MPQPQIAVTGLGAAGSATLRRLARRGVCAIGGHGFKFSPVVGEIAADLVTGGTTRHDIAPFRLGRFS